MTEDVLAGRRSSSERTHLIESLLPFGLETYFGDSNFDGVFDSGDFVHVFVAGEYEDAIDGNSSWSDGDWNGDEEFDSSDLVVAFQDGGYEKGPRTAATVPVPEPNSSIVLMVAIGIVGTYLRAQMSDAARSDTALDR